MMTAIKKPVSMPKNKPIKVSASVTRACESMSCQSF